jgi:hypothetical protein
MSKLPVVMYLPGCDLTVKLNVGESGIRLAVGDMEFTELTQSDLELFGAGIERARKLLHEDNVERKSKLESAIWQNRQYGHFIRIVVSFNEGRSFVIEHTDGRKWGLEEKELQLSYVPVFDPKAKGLFKSQGAKA